MMIEGMAHPWLVNGIFRLPPLDLSAQKLQPCHRNEVCTTRNSENIDEANPRPVGADLHSSISLPAVRLPKSDIATLPEVFPVLPPVSPPPLLILTPPSSSKFITSSISVNKIAFPNNYPTRQIQDSWGSGTYRPVPGVKGAFNSMNQRRAQSMNFAKEHNNFLRDGSRIDNRYLDMPLFARRRQNLSALSGPNPVGIFKNSVPLHGNNISVNTHIPSNKENPQSSASSTFSRSCCSSPEIPLKPRSFRGTQGNAHYSDHQNKLKIKKHSPLLGNYSRSSFSPAGNLYYKSVSQKYSDNPRSYGSSLNNQIYPATPHSHGISESLPQSTQSDRHISRMNEATNHLIPPPYKNETHIPVDVAPNKSGHTPNEEFKREKQEIYDSYRTEGNIYYQLENHHPHSTYNYEQIKTPQPPHTAPIAGNPAGKKKRSNFTKKTKEKLLRWLEQHVDNPYPSEADKQSLADETSLTLSQVNNWFVNARRRNIWINARAKRAALAAYHQKFLASGNNQNIEEFGALGTDSSDSCGIRGL